MSVLHLTASKSNSSPDFEPFPQEFFRMSDPVVIIVVADVRSELNLLDNDFCLLFFSFFLFFAFLVLEFSIVHNLANWRRGVWCDLN